MVPHIPPGSDGHPDDAHMARRFDALRDVNEQLVLTAIRAQESAEVHARRHDDAVRAAELDVLTGLPNRIVLLEHFARDAAVARRHGAHVAVLFIDLDNFKQVNDTLGHATGDVVLRRVSDALRAALRDGDTLCRHGGDEFVVLLADLAQPGQIIAITEQLIAAIGAPSLHEDSVVRLTASVGVSLFPDDGDDPRELIALADAAMYRAKRLRTGGFALHQPGVITDEGAPARPPVLRMDVAARLGTLRTAELQEANEQLVLAALSAQAMQAHAEETRKRQQEFMAILAHELRNPLTPMRNVSALLAGGVNDAQGLARLQGIIERQVAHMSRLVDDLLDVTRFSTGKLQLRLERIELADVLAEAIAACRPSMDLRLQQFTALVPADPVWVNADRLRLTQVVANLLDNASKYTQTGGAIALSVTARDADVSILVADDGTGIAAEVLPHIFELFAQDAHGASQAGGLGIGLTVVHDLVLAHHGTVVARNNPRGPGSEFEVVLPRVVPAAMVRATGGPVERR